MAIIPFLPPKLAESDPKIMDKLRDLEKLIAELQKKIFPFQLRKPSIVNFLP